MSSCDCGEASMYDDTWGWVCPTCKEELDRVDRETDWDEYESEKRERMAEENEY